VIERKKRADVAGIGQALNEAIHKHHAQQTAFLQHEAEATEEANAVGIVMGWAVADQVATLSAYYQNAVLEWEKSKGIIMLKKRTESAMQQTNVLIEQSQGNLGFWRNKASQHKVELDS
jgi:hypothetical protein